MKGLSLDNEVFAAFAWYGVLIVLKMMLLSAAISSTRVLTKTFANEEDVRAFGSSVRSKDKPAVSTHPTVERVSADYANSARFNVEKQKIGLWKFNDYKQLTLYNYQE